MLLQNKPRENISQMTAIQHKLEWYSK